MVEFDGFPFSRLQYQAFFFQVTTKLLEEWEAKMGTEPTVSLISDTAEVFKAAIDGLGSVEAAAAAKKAKKDDEDGKKAEKQQPGRFVE